ncbi:MAG: hypothetical protein PHO91_03435 [Patescibacteria group bacterium]|nr:hypothetical protein [Patescibacteria group bacterium]
MNLEKDKLLKMIEGSNHILLTGPKNPNLDVVSSAIAWSVFLSKQNKKSDIVFAGATPFYSFFSKNITIKDQLGDLNSFKIILDVSQTKVKQLSYDLKSDKKELQIDIVPENGIFKSENIRSEVGDYKYDLVLVFGAEDLEMLGEIFSEHRHFFYNSTIVNIDNSLLNENFGQLDIVDSAAASLAEISYFFLAGQIDQEIATALLAGIIFATKSFQSPKVNPKILTLAGDLIVAGAKREEIVEALYRTKDISALKSWGKILSRLEQKGSIAFSYLKHDELRDLPQDFESIVRDFILASPGFLVFVIFYQRDFNSSEAWIYTLANINALDILPGLEIVGNRRLAKVVLDKDLAVAKEIVLSKIATKLKLLASS